METKLAIVEKKPELDRRKYIGGSDVPCIFGVTPWKTAYQLWEEKIAEEIIVPEFEPQREKVLRRGKKLEPWVVELLEEEQGIKAINRNQRYFDHDYPWMTCEIDFEHIDALGRHCNGDIKTVSPFAAGEWGELGTDEFPLSYCLQFLWGLMITRRPNTLCAALIGADDLRTYAVERDEDLIIEIRRRVIEFWEINIKRRVPPKPQDQQDINRALYKHRGFVSPGSEKIWQAVKRLKGIRAAKKRLTLAEDEQQFAIKEALLLEAQAMGLEEGNCPKKFIINNGDGKEIATLSMQHRSGYTVAPTDYLVLKTK